MAAVWSLDEDENAWITMGANGKKIRVPCKEGVEYKAVVEGSSRPPKWGRANKASTTPGPKMGAKPFERAPKAQQRRSGAYVCCQTPGCPGVHGRASYRYFQDLDEAGEELFCIGPGSRQLKLAKSPPLRIPPPNALSPKKATRPRALQCHMPPRLWKALMSLRTLSLLLLPLKRPILLPCGAPVCP